MEPSAIGHLAETELADFSMASTPHGYLLNKNKNRGRTRSPGNENSPEFGLAKNT
jgi:hypothetical protein